MASQVPPEVSEPIAAAARDVGVDVYHAELSGRALRVQVESAGGVSVRLCSEFSRAVSVRLDAAGFLHGQYVLEVSSPGVERSLYRPEDYVKALNKDVRVLVRDGWVEGLLEAAGPSGITLRVQDAEPRTSTDLHGRTRQDAGRESGVESRELSWAEIREGRVRVSDSELFARSVAGPRRER